MTFREKIGGLSIGAIVLAFGPANDRPVERLADSKGIDNDL